MPPLHISSQLGPADLVRFLVIGGADVEYINKVGVKTVFIEIFFGLFNNYINFLNCFQYGKDAEQIAVENKQFEVARLMKELKQVIL